MAEQFRLSNAELINEIAVLAFLNGSEEGTKFYEAFAAGRVTYELYKRLTVSQADVLRAQTILKICDYVKKNPKASQAQLKAEVGKEITAFAQQVSQL